MSRPAPTADELATGASADAAQAAAKDHPATSGGASAGEHASADVHDEHAATNDRAGTHAHAPVNVHANANANANANAETREHDRGAAIGRPSESIGVDTSRAAAIDARAADARSVARDSLAAPGDGASDAAPNEARAPNEPAASAARATTAIRGADEASPDLASASSALAIDPAAAPSADEAWMDLALREADRASSLGEVPVGCVLVGPDGAILAVAHNQRETLQDPTAHAEMIAIRAAAEKVGSWRLEGVTCFVTLEPCAMCAGALVHARVARVVYGCDDPKGGAVATLFTIGADPRLNHRFTLVRGVRSFECASRLRAFFAALRALGKK